MNGAIIAIVAVVVLAGAYLTYGSYVARKLGIDPARPTPANTKKDGVDYVPTPSFVLMGHHFASIAGAAPIAGPITAAVFGWFPVVLWIFVGGIFAGAVHDFAALVSSVRHGGKSVGEVIGENVGARGRILFLIFAWLALLLVIAAFTNIVANTYAAIPEAATSSILFVMLAVLFGVGVYRAGYGMAVSSVVGVSLLFLAIYLGYLFPIKIDANSWKWILLGYIFVASTAPVWVLLQPRDYLNSFLLYASLGAALLGILIAQPTLQLPAYTTFDAAPIGLLFPMLFVTVACGAISGFHSLVASGTTAKQLRTEAHAKRIGYGSMLIECFLAITAIIAAASFASGALAEAMKGGAFAVYAQGIGAMLVVIGIPAAASVTFFSLAASAFAITSLDTATRLARYAMQELSACGGFQNVPGLNNRFVATAITVAAAGFLLFSGQFAAIWPMFGASNQLVAALALLAVAVWLANRKMDNRFVLVPMVFMLAVTITALVVMFFQRVQQGNWLLAALCVLLFVLAVVLVWMGYQVLSGSRKAPAPATIAGASGEEE